MNKPVTALDERNDDPDTTDTENKKFAGDTNNDGVIDETDRNTDEDEHNSDEMLEKPADKAVQADPDPDEDPDAPSTGVVAISRMVYENVPSTSYVGDPITGLGDRDTIGGPDGAAFIFAESADDSASVYYDAPLLDGAVGDVANDKAGQLALRPVNKLDHEGAKNTYVVEITDPNSAFDISTYRITIMVMDVNEAPSAPSELRGLPPALNTDPMFAATSTTFSVDENTAENTATGMVVGTVTATDADRGDQETLMYSLDDGADAGSFAIDSATGEITTTAMLDYEMQDSYMVTVTATDDDEATAMIYVTIMVNDLGLDNAYDMNENGAIDRSEVIEAIRDFLFNRTIDREQVIEVIRLYLTS